jgi:hypothetical protein
MSHLQQHQNLLAANHQLYPDGVEDSLVHKPADTSNSRQVPYRWRDSLRKRSLLPPPRLRKHLALSGGKRSESRTSSPEAAS